MSEIRNSLEVVGPVNAAYAEILNDGALVFIADLCAEFAPRVAELMDLRVTRQQEIDGGTLPDFLPDSRGIQESDWTVCPIPADLQDRRVEITGPTERKMIINALNSGAKVFMADCEDSQTPTWDNVVQGQINLRDAARRTIRHEANGKQYALNEKIATLIVRPRGWHLPEKHILQNAQPVPAALVDFGLYLFHNAAELKRQGTGPYFYLPKLESHLEARLWSDVFRFAEDAGVVGRGEIKTIRRLTNARWPKCGRTRNERRATGTTARGLHTPAWCCWPWKYSMNICLGPISSSGGSKTCISQPPICCRSSKARLPRPGCATTSM